MRAWVAIAIVYLNLALGTAHADDGAGAVRAVIEAQQAAWNRGDIAAFMAGYWHDEGLRFASGHDVHRGWQATLTRYLATYPDRAAMGRLTFTDLEIEILSADHALAFGRWHLERAGDAPGGLFTLHFIRTEDGWRIASDHTSS